jgi:hypothetical protein
MVKIYTDTKNSRRKSRKRRICNEKLEFRHVVKRWGDKCQGY